MIVSAIWAALLIACGVVGLKSGSPWLGGFNLFLAGLFIHDLIHGFQDAKRR